MPLQSSAAQSADTLSRADDRVRLAQLRETIEHTAHLLPAQGPITVFVHHNTLHALEDLPFHEAVTRGARLYGCQPYLSEGRFRQELARGRIEPGDLQSVLRADLSRTADISIAGLATRFELRMAMLQHPLRQGPDAELRWLVAETDALRRFRADVSREIRDRMLERTRHWIMRDLRNDRADAHSQSSMNRRVREAVASLLEHYGESSIERWSEATWEALTLQTLWRACHRGVHGLPPFAAQSPAPLRHRDLLLEATGEDSDLLVNEVLIPLCAAFLDQGFAHWSLPDRDRGLYQAFLTLYRGGGGPANAWPRELGAELARLDDAGIGPLECIDESLRSLGIGDQEREAFISATLLALRGWAGMLWQLETRSDRAVVAAPPGSLVEFLAVRLILERHAVARAARNLPGFACPLHDVRRVARGLIPKREPLSAELRAFFIFQLAQVMGWTADELFRLSRSQWSALIEEIEAFPSLERRRIFHEAYERRFYAQTLDAISAFDARRQAQDSAPAFQVVCCIDEREESFRRHLEEVAPDVETFGAAGFYGVAMYYRGAAEAHYTPLCPVVIRPRHWVREHVVDTFEKSHRRRARTRRLLGTAAHRLHLGSRTFAGGALLSTLLGPLASVPLLARVLFPRLTARIRRMAGRLVRTPPVTRLQLERTEAAPGPEGGHVGFTLEEMAAMVERLLRDLGIATRLARLVIITGHGSSSLNNPHESAHDCGACSGARGGPNARAFAQMANDSRVRALVAGNGLEIPPETAFVGAYHNTCDDSVTYFDLDDVPASHKGEFEQARRAIDAARERSAHERCRRFESAPLSLSTEAGLRHVEGRAEDLAQTRPEYGHATNAITIVGRRSRTRGLFLDRRAFLTSYDPTQDDAEHSILTRILQAVIPVCAGISLEYYFSYVDPTGYGCGTKLPHNITSLLGVMDGAASDLRTGLPWQMVEIHEPVRELFLIETTPQAMSQIMDRNPAIGTLCRNEWVRVATISPESSQIHMLRAGRFEPYTPETTNLPETGSSIDWYRGWRDHLGFAAIGPHRRSTTQHQNVKCMARASTA